MVRAAVVLAVVASAGGAYAVAVSDHTADRTPIAALTLATAWSFLAAGYVAWRRRPENRIGLYLIANGALWLLTLLQASNIAVLFTAGALTSVLAKAAFAQTLLAYPEGRLRSPLERVPVAAAWLDVTVLQLVALTVTPLPRNLLLIGSNPGVSASLHSYQRWIAVGASAAALVLVAARLRRATPPLRRALLPVVGVGLVTFALIAATAAANEAGAIGAGVWLNYFQIAAFGCVPLGFLVGLLRSRLARFGVADLVVELGQAPEPGRLRESLARALGDDSLEVAYWLPETASYVDVDGRPVELPDDDARRSVTRIDRGGRRVAAIVHDAALDDEPQLVHAAGAAAGMALENERLQAELRATVDELRASRARIVEAAADERRRLERNLHDGAQQRLLALSFGLGLAETADDEAALRAAVADAKEELAVALERAARARPRHPPGAPDRARSRAGARESRRPQPGTGDGRRRGRAPAGASRGRRLLPRQRGARERGETRTCDEALDRGAETRGRDRGRGRRRRRRRRDLGRRVGAARSLRPCRGTRWDALREQPARRRYAADGGVAVRVVVADDSVLLREGLVRILEHAGFEVIAQAGSLDELLLRARSYKPDIVITDIRMPPTHGDEGIRAAKQIRAERPETAVLVLSQYVELSYAMDLLADGTERMGYLLKDRVSAVTEFVDAVRRVAEGGSAVDPAVVAQLVGMHRDNDPLAELTPREREVLELMAEGRSNSGIAARLFVTEHAVEKHIRSILRKLAIDADRADHRRVLAVLTFLRAS